jgi:hypothetical protein
MRPSSSASTAAPADQRRSRTTVILKRASTGRAYILAWLDRDRPDLAALNPQHVDRVQRPALTRLHSAFRISWDFETARPNAWSNSISEEISNSCLIRSRSAPLGFSSGLRRKLHRVVSNRRFQRSPGLSSSPKT